MCAARRPARLVHGLSVPFSSCLSISVSPSTYLAVALRGRFGTLEEAARQRVLAPLRVRLVRVRGRVRFGFGVGFGFELGVRVCACALR